MDHLFVSWELSKQLKDKGFDEKCLGYYNWKGKFYFMTMGLSNSDAEQALPEGTVAAPIYQQVVDWFREKHDTVVLVNRDIHSGKILGWEGTIEKGIDGFETGKTCDNYYGALTKAIEKALKLI